MRILPRAQQLVCFHSEKTTQTGFSGVHDGRRMDLKADESRCTGSLSPINSGQTSKTHTKPAHVKAFHSFMTIICEFFFFHVCEEFNQVHRCVLV